MCLFQFNLSIATWDRFYYHLHFPCEELKLHEGKKPATVIMSVSGWGVRGRCSLVLELMYDITTLRQTMLTWHCFSCLRQGISLRTSSSYGAELGMGGTYVRSGKWKWGIGHPLKGGADPMTSQHRAAGKPQPAPVSPCAHVSHLSLPPNSNLMSTARCLAKGRGGFQRGN